LEDQRVRVECRSRRHATERVAHRRAARVAIAGERAVGAAVGRGIGRIIGIDGQRSELELLSLTDLELGQIVERRRRVDVQDADPQRLVVLARPLLTVTGTE